MVLNGNDIIEFEPITDTTRNIIKVVGVGGGGCNAVGNMYREGMESVTFAVCNTDSKSLSINPVPTKIMLGKEGLGAGANPDKGREEAEQSIEDIKRLFGDSTQMVFVVAAMGGGTGTGAGPFVAKIAREMGLLTVGIVTLPFYFEKRPKIRKALGGLDEMRKNVDALLIINNEQISKVFSDSHIPVEEALQRADIVMGNAVRSISELITVTGKIQTDFSDVKTTMRNGGGAVMAIGRASGEHRVRNAVLDALNSPLLYGSDISKATRILFNIYTSKDHQLFVDELEEIDAFMDELSPDIDVIWGMATDDTLDEDAKITILATGFDNSLPMETKKADEEGTMEELIEQLYGRKRIRMEVPQKEDPPFTVTVAPDPEPAVAEEQTIVQENEDTEEENNGNNNGNNNGGQEETVTDPAKGFLDRVRSRILQGLQTLTEPEE
ncbi:MAG: cell division protein FtsZ [Prevotella sp.]|nr:cell division protein FtsZ [Prevotella sp.]